MNVVVPAALLSACAMIYARFASQLLRRDRRDKYKRGVLIADGRPVQRRSARRKRLIPEVLTLAGVALAPGDETKHFKLIGATGTGKSTAIRELMGGAIARGDRAVFADPDAGYLQHFYDRCRGDIILNPFEANSAKWDLFAEIETGFDVDQLARGLIPNCNDAAAQEWRGYARIFLAALIRECRFRARRDAAELWRLLMIASAAELRPIVAGTPAQPFLDADNSRMFASIRAVAGSSIAAFEHMQAQRAAPFAIRTWVRNRASRALLFIPYKAGQIAALRSMIATWMYLAIFEAMSSSLDEDQRLWFVIDELDALGAIDGLKDALARLRKFGCRCVLSFQSAAQVSSTYGREGDTILENCSNSLILRCAGSENGGTSQFASRLIGEREVVRCQVSQGRDRDAAFSSRAGRRSRNISHQHVTETAVLASELEQLPDLCGYFKSASSRSWLKVSLPRG